MGTLDAGLQQRAGNGHLRGLLGLALAGRATDAHVGHAGVFHNGGNIGKIQIDKAGIPNQIGNGLHRLPQHIIGDLKGVGKRDLLVCGVLEPLIGDDDQRIHLVLQLGNAAFRLLHPGGGPQSRRAL